MTPTQPLEAIRAEIANLKKLAEAATPGPWKADDHKDWHQPQTDIRNNNGTKVVRFVDGAPQFWCTVGKAEYEWANAAYIAAANPQTILAIIAALEASKPLLAGGWKMVPVEPTEKMLEVAVQSSSCEWDQNTPDDYPYQQAKEVYRAMLSASPGGE